MQTTFEYVSYEKVLHRPELMECRRCLFFWVFFFSNFYFGVQEKKKGDISTVEAKNTSPLKNGFW